MRQSGRDTSDVPGWTAKIAAAFHSFKSAASRTFRRKIRSTPFPEKDGGVPFNASGVVPVGTRRFVFVDNHESASLFEFALDADGLHVQRIRRRRLLGVAEGQLGDPEGLTRVDVNGETFLIAASSLCVANAAGSGQRHINDGLVRVRYTADGDLHAEAMLGFRSWLLSHEPSLAEAGALEPDAGGLNIEGLAWDPHVNALLFGLRGPANLGQVTVIRVPLDAGVAAWGRGAQGAIRLARPHYRTGAAPGIRDISYDEEAGDFLILLGRSCAAARNRFSCVPGTAPATRSGSSMSPSTGP